MEEEIAQNITNLNSFIGKARTKLQAVLSQLNWKEEVLLLSHKDEKEETGDMLKNTKNSKIVKEEMYTTVLEEGAIMKEQKDSEKIYNEIMASLPQPKVEKEIDEDRLIREQLVAERDAKRRRISYKNKVHTKSKSHTEILREVIQQQMMAFEEWMSQEPGTGGELVSKSETNKESANNDGTTDLIDLGDVGGNSHTLWKHVGDILRKRQEMQEEEESRKEWRNRKEDCQRHRHDNWRRRHNNAGDSHDEYRIKRRKYDEEEGSTSYKRVSNGSEDKETNVKERSERIRDSSGSYRRVSHNYEDSETKSGERDERKRDSCGSYRRISRDYEDCKLVKKEKDDRRRDNSKERRKEQRHSRREHHREETDNKDEVYRKKEIAKKKKEHKRRDRERSTEKKGKQERKHSREQYDNDITLGRYYDGY